MEEKIRLDQALVEKGLAPTRSKAQALIMAGLVFLGESRLESCAQRVGLTDALWVKEKLHPFVSRGGVKLQAYMDAVAFQPRGLHCVDVGASTGGFTDCLLQSGATRVLCIDVGYGQLADKLRQDARVSIQDRTNFRHYDLKLFPWAELHCATVDVAFISLTKILPKLFELFDAYGRGAQRIIMLVKPQFELGRAEVNKKGLVRRPELALQLIENIKELCAKANWKTEAQLPSPIKGRTGNQEYLLGVVK